MSAVPVSERVSSLNSLCRCPGFYVLSTTRGPAGRAAQTGTAVGRLIELWHRAGEPRGPGAIVELCDQVQFEGATRTPLADWDEVAQMAGLYAGDPRNHGVVLAESCEAEVRITLPAAPEDPTGRPFTLVGHLDQLRRGSDGVLRVWDLKSGKGSGIEMIHSYAWQLAGYALASTETYGETVLPGGIIRLRGYLGKRASTPEARVFFATPWTLQQCEAILETAIYDIGVLRAGTVPTRPGVYCAYCPAGGPHVCSDNITDLLDA